MKHINRVPIALLLVMFSHWVGAAAYQSHSSIREAVQNYLMQEIADNGETVTVQVGKIDPRLRLKQCETPLEVSLPRSSRRVGGITAKVSCKAGVTWAIYIQSEVERFGSVIVAKRGLRKGDIISRDDVELTERSLGKINGGYITKIEDILGWQVKRNIRIDKVVSPNSIKRKMWVKRGDVVVIVAKHGQFEVKMSGVAKGSGGKGDTVQVINQSSKKLIEGVVIGPGVVQVPM